MRKLLILTLLVIGFFSCNRKSTMNWEPLTEKDLKEHKGLLDSIVRYNQIVDSLSTGITIDTGDGNRIRFYDGTTLKFSTWEPRLDTSDVIVKYVCNWEEGEIETIASKIVYTVSRFGVWSNSLGIPQESKLYKVRDGIWIPIEWPKDIVNVYIRPKK